MHACHRQAGHGVLKDALQRSSHRIRGQQHPERVAEVLFDERQVVCLPLIIGLPNLRWVSALAASITFCALPTSTVIRSGAVYFIPRIILEGRPDRCAPQAEPRRIGRRPPQTANGPMIKVVP